VSDARDEVGKPLLVSLVVVWVFAFVAFFIVQHILEASRAAGEFVKFGISITMMQPGYVVVHGLILSILFSLHWWLSGLFGKPGIASRPIANLMLVAAGLCILQIISEGTSRDYFELSVLCRQGEPPVTILVDEFYICERSMLVTQTAMWMSFALPLFAVPVRILESRILKKRK